MLPLDILMNEVLNGDEKMMLSLYYYFTNGAGGGCYWKNREVAEMLKVSEHTVQNYKKHLKELGYIKVDGLCTTCLLNTGVAKSDRVSHKKGSKI